MSPSDDDIKKVKDKAVELEGRKEWLGDWNPKEFELAETRKEFAK